MQWNTGTKHIEQEVNLIRLNIYEETKGLTPEQYTKGAEDWRSRREEIWLPACQRTRQPEK